MFCKQYVVLKKSFFLKFFKTVIIINSLNSYTNFILFNFYNYIFYLHYYLKFFFKKSFQEASVFLNTISKPYFLHTLFFFFISVVFCMKVKNFIFLQKSRNFINKFVNKNNLLFLTKTYKTETKLNSYLFFLIGFLLKYCVFVIKKKTQIYIKNFSFTKQVAFRTLTQWFFKKYNKLQKKFSKFFYIKEFIEVLFYFFISKDVFFFIKWLKRLMEKMNFKKHKLFLAFLKNFLKKWFKYFCYLFKIYGFVLQVKGKISLGGNAKKKKHLITLGSYSFNNYTTKVSYYQDFVWTKTGSLGLKIYLFYM